MFLLIFVNLSPVSLKVSCLMISWFGWILIKTLKVQSGHMSLFFYVICYDSFDISKASMQSLLNTTWLEENQGVWTHFQAQLGHILLDKACVCMS